MKAAQPGTGKVFLVGAGPGDPELLTLKAVRCLARADVVLVNDLVDPRALEHAPRARVVHVGKRAGCRSTPQRFIERLMVRFAKSGRAVVRLKCGDPFLFGRGGEEAIALRRDGVPFEVVNGVSAGVAAPAAAGIPVTHRGVARGVTFVTGHTADGGDVDWAALARARTTLVIFMAVAALPAIVARLRAAGMPADVPAAAIERASWPDERRLRSTLADLPAAAARAGLRSPAILVIGDAVALAGTASASAAGEALGIAA
jgi:uroporphyrin-III C-methyltransferase